MKKNVFIEKLSYELKSRLTKEEVIEVIAYYEELISDRLDLGENEEDIVDSLGSIDHIVKVISIESLEKRKPTKNIKDLLFSSKNLLILATTPFLIIMAIVFGSIVFSLGIALAATFIAFAASLLSIIVSLGFSIALVISDGGGLFLGFAVTGGHILAFGFLLILMLWIKDILYLLINQSISLFTAVFKKKVI